MPRSALQRRTLQTAATVILLCIGNIASPEKPAKKRFRIMGDGLIWIASTKTKETFRGRYRSITGNYIPAAIRQINRVFGIQDRDQDQGVGISLRLIERLSRLRKIMKKGARITITSGYRSPAYNQRLRDKGGTVAKASLHQYGMAVDMHIKGVDMQMAWKKARKLRLGGAGYYGSRWIHLDTGPVRFWTQSSANVRRGTSLFNKRIILVPRYDIYRRDELLEMQFARITAFPIGVVANGFRLERRTPKRWQTVGTYSANFGRLPRHPGERTKACLAVESPAKGRDIKIHLPIFLKSGTYRLRAYFCNTADATSSDPQWPGMPTSIASYPFQIIR